MIGNDVVDRHDDDSSARRHHPRFDARVYSESERAWMGRSADPEHLRWSLWAAKEAAYKLLRRSRPRTVFSPPRFVVRPAVGSDVTVEAGGSRVRVLLDGGASFVHAVAIDAASGAPGMLRAVALADGGDPGAAVRSLAVRAIANELGEATAALSIERDARMPQLLLRGRGVVGTLSLSHHGRYVAVAWTPVRYGGVPARSAIPCATTRPARCR